jgi:hypothetical protein
MVALGLYAVFVAGSLPVYFIDDAFGRNEMVEILGWCLALSAVSLVASAAAFGLDVLLRGRSFVLRSGTSATIVALALVVAFNTQAPFLAVFAIPLVVHWIGLIGERLLWSVVGRVRRLAQ